VNYQGPRVVAGAWKGSKVARQAEPCVVCGEPAILRHPVTEEPCHKACENDVNAVCVACGEAGEDHCGTCGSCPGVACGCDW
jgi:hypothetical protein